MTFYLYIGGKVTTLSAQSWEEAKAKVYSEDPPRDLGDVRTLIEATTTPNGPETKHIATFHLVLKMARPSLIINEDGRILEFRGVLAEITPSYAVIEFPTVNLTLKLKGKPYEEFKRTKEYKQALALSKA